MSLGGKLTSEQVALAQPTFTAARAAGILMVAAAGNDGVPIRMYPASFNGVVSVSAVDAHDEIADFSNTGRAIDIAAPGVDLISTVARRRLRPVLGHEHGRPARRRRRRARPGRPGPASPSTSSRRSCARAPSISATPGHDTTYGDGRVDAAAALAEPVPDPLPNLEPPAPRPR